MFVSMLAGANSIQNAANDPLAGIDVIYNTGQAFPGTGNTITATGANEVGNTVTITTTANHNLQPGATVTIAGVGVADYNGTWVVATVPTNTTFTYTNPTAGLAASGGGTVATQTRARLNAFFARGGGYVGTAVSATNFTFLSGAVPALVTSPFTLTSSGAGGGITTWDNVGGASSPITGGYPATDYLFMPSNVTYFTATPAGCGHRRPQQREHGRDGAERPVARLRRGPLAQPRGDLERRRGGRPREDDGEQPLRRLLGQPVLAAGRRA